MAGKQFGLAIRDKKTKQVRQRVWFPLEKERDETMAKTKLSADCEFSTEARDCKFDPTAKPGEWINR